MCGLSTGLQIEKSDHIAYQESNTKQNVHVDDADNRHQLLNYPVKNKSNDVRDEVFVKGCNKDL